MKPRYRAPQTMKPRYRAPWVWALCMGLACAMVWVWPALDLWIALQFYAQNGLFPANQWWAVQAVYVWAPPLGWVLTCAMLAVLGWRWWRPGQIRVGLWRQAVAWLLVAVLGIGLVVHEALKDQVGRPRPNQVIDMGGSVPYVPALQLSTSCERNCSFVSGHASLGFCLLALGMWAAPSRRRRWLWVGLLAGSGVGGVRMVQGGHYFSDVLFAFLAIWGTALLVRELWLRVRWWQLRRRHSSVQLA